MKKLLLSILFIVSIPALLIQFMFGNPKELVEPSPDDLKPNFSNDIDDNIAREYLRSNGK